MHTFKNFLPILALFFTTLFGMEEVDLSCSTHEEVEFERDNFLLSTPRRILPKVDPVSGIYVEEACDLVVAGIEPLSLRRFYCSSTPYEPRYGCWSYNPEAFVVGSFEVRMLGSFISVGNREGRIVEYTKCSWEDKCFSRYQGGGGFALPSGKRHPLNTTVTFSHAREKGTSFAYQGEIVDGDGTRRTFESAEFPWLQRVFT